MMHLQEHLLDASLARYLPQIAAVPVPLPWDSAIIIADGILRLTAIQDHRNAGPPHIKTVAIAVLDGVCPISGGYLRPGVGRRSFAAVIASKRAHGARRTNETTAYSPLGERMWPQPFG
jgi:hypothetical protein